MGPTQQTETTTIYLTYDELSSTVTREPSGEFKVANSLNSAQVIRTNVSN